MKQLRFLAVKLSVTCLALFATSTAFATGATVTISTSVPTLSGTMLLVLSVLLFIVAFRVTKTKRENSAKLFMTLLGASALLSAGGGVKLIHEAQAGSAPTVQLVSGIKEYRAESGDNIFENNSGQTISIISIIEDADSTCTFFDGTSAELCDVAVPLTAPINMPSGTFCALRCSPNGGGG